MRRHHNMMIFDDKFSYTEMMLFISFFHTNSITIKACQLHRDYYRSYKSSRHPLTYFKEPEYMWQCPSEMSHVYLSFPAFHVRYKHPTVVPATLGRTSDMPALPNRCLAARYNKPPCKAFIR
ncbi:hypothetical protein O3G_MSEX009774 [Manduca sexta]|uniref:Uncharacterized protein n=1 Tax=Manduca sexta TaxID=7130 RepID=A0A921ZF80_MANSE|nr:hypothetical protein O3G_MSEX009774 [Manduca sexta]